jgi:thymidylate synthase (FAD)
MNGRELRHFLKLRLAKNAQWEIRKLAQEVLKLLNDVCPVLVADIKEE